MRVSIVVFCFMVSVIPVFSADTMLHYYTPLDETQGAIVSKMQGDCISQSLLIKREDAWRCVAEGQTYDPCFVPRFGSHLEATCVSSPWSNEYIHIRVSAPLDNQAHETIDMSRTYPWAMKLTQGETCLAIDSHKMIDDLPVRYRCEGGAELFGHVQRCHSNWKMLKHSSRGVETVEIENVWF